MAYTAHFDTVQKLYIAYYQRPADPAGLRYWSQIIEVSNGDAATVVDEFINSDESKDLYGTVDATTITTVVKAIYAALFNRTLADTDGGLKFYVDGFNAGTYTAGGIALDILSGAKGVDAVAMQNKLHVANLFTEVVDGRDLTNPAFGGGGNTDVTYDSKDATAARAILKTVDADPSTLLDQAGVKAAIISNGIADAGDSIISDGTGNVFNLTTKSGEIIKGTVGDDVFYAQVGGGNQATLQSGDTVDGNGTSGYDTINIEFDKNTDKISGGVTFINIDKIQAVYNGDANVISLTGTKNIQSIKDISITAENSSGKVNVSGFNNLQSIGLIQAKDATLHTFKGKLLEKVSISGAHDNDLIVHIDNDKGTVKTVDLSVDGVGYATGNGVAKDFTVELSKPTEVLNIIANNDKSNISKINSTHGNGVVKLDKITLSGDADIKIGLNNSAVSRVKTIDGSDATGELNISVGKVANQASIIGGKGNDQILVTADGASSYVVLTGGAGEDTFDVSASKAKKGIVSITDFEKGDIINTSISTLTHAVTTILKDVTYDVAKGLAPSIGTIVNSNVFLNDGQNIIEYFELNNDIYLIIYGDDKNQGGTSTNYDAKFGDDDMIIRLVNFSLEDVQKISVKEGNIIIN